MEKNSDQDSTETGLLPDSFIAEREEFYIDVTGKTTFLGCGDDREPTAASSDSLRSEYPDVLPLREGYSSIYGGLAGVAKNVLITGIAQYGPSFVEQVGGYDGALLKAHSKSDGQSAGLIPTLHSAANNEQSDDAFDMDSAEGLGCAYAAGIGATSGLLTRSDSLIRDVARQDQVRVFGNDNGTDRLLDAHRVFLEQGTSGASDTFALSRQDYAAGNAPIIILAGKPHASAKSTGLISNFEQQTVRNSTAANTAGRDFYNQDIAGVSAWTLAAFDEYGLDPELLMRAFLLDSTPVRAVLVAHDSDPEAHGTLNPLKLAMGVRGNVQAALEELRRP